MTAGNTPRVTYSFSQKELKGEDRVLVQGFRIGEEKCLLVLVCDGHGGPHCAAYATQQFCKLMEPHLPKSFPDWSAALAIGEFADEMRTAVAHATHQTDTNWNALGSTAGSTLTLAVVTGQLLTIANVGDSTGILDTGATVQELTLSHRLNDNPTEQQRLRARGLLVSPLAAHMKGPARDGEMGLGPLRLWPGGLCVARSIGDSDAGPMVVPLPHLRQLLVPRQGIRLVLASDGLWDLMTPDKAAKVVRRMANEDAAAALVATAAADRRISDDVSVVVVDMLPPNRQWPEIVAGYAAVMGGGGCCGGGKEPVRYSEGPDDTSAPPRISYLADVDAMVAFPALLPHEMAPREQADLSAGLRRDLTMHGGGDAEPYLYSGQGQAAQ